MREDAELFNRIAAKTIESMREGMREEQSSNPALTVVERGGGGEASETATVSEEGVGM